MKVSNILTTMMMIATMCVVNSREPFLHSAARVFVPEGGAALGDRTIDILKAGAQKTKPRNGSVRRTANAALEWAEQVAGRVNKEIGAKLTKYGIYSAHDTLPGIIGLVQKILIEKKTQEITEEKCKDKLRELMGLLHLYACDSPVSGGPKFKAAAVLYYSLGNGKVLGNTRAVAKRIAEGPFNPWEQYRLGDNLYHEPSYHPDAIKNVEVAFENEEAFNAALESIMRDDVAQNQA